jgi:hypothetical protein
VRRSRYGGLAVLSDNREPNCRQFLNVHYCTVPLGDALSSEHGPDGRRSFHKVPAAIVFCVHGAEGQRRDQQAFQRLPALGNIASEQASKIAQGSSSRSRLLAQCDASHEREIRAMRCWSLHADCLRLRLEPQDLEKRGANLGPARLW